VAIHPKDERAPSDKDRGSDEVRDMLAAIPELWGSAGAVHLPDAAFDAIARAWTKSLEKSRAEEPRNGR